MCRIFFKCSTLFFPLFQVTNAQKYGAKAILIYNDPQDSAPVPDEDLYPHGWWLPRSGVQRGSILLGTGDPLTPRYPSKGTAEMFWFDKLLQGNNEALFGFFQFVVKVVTIAIDEMMILEIITTIAFPFQPSLTTKLRNFM